jgi:DNA repair protein RecN
MLSRLVIKNIALITELEVNLSGGMNVLSGETGAGKSIIVDSVNLVLGERADREMIRTGEEKAVVEAWFTGARCVDDLLEEQQIEPAEDLVLSRELSVSGKNVCRINGALVTLAALKAVSDRLVDVHGQHEHQALLSEKNHMAMLDGFDPRIAGEAQQVAQGYGAYTAVQARLKTLLAGADRERRIDILKYQIAELQQAGITEGEEEELQQKKKRMNATERVAEALGAAYEQLYESETHSVLATLKDISGRLQSISDVDEKFEAFISRADEAYYALDELSSDIRREMDSCSFDAEELERIEERLALIHTLSRKYGDPLATGAFLKKAEQELADLSDSEALAQQLTEKARQLRAGLYAESVRLSNLRREAARLFEQRVAEQLADLGMVSASFAVQFEALKSEEDCAFTRNGIDTVEFFISANRGEPRKALRKVASGGEVSRIMLALKNIAADRGGIPTMIFDEIDTGISGRMAQVVAEKLFSISKGRQVICVTHLPQIASMADAHFLVTKESDATSTHTFLTPLGETQRIEEVARLAGGESAVTQAHAQEMIARADAFKSTIH